MTDDTLLILSADISRGSREMTWGELRRLIGGREPGDTLHGLIDKVRATLESGGTYDMDGLLIYRKVTT